MEGRALARPLRFVDSIASTIAAPDQRSETVPFAKSICLAPKALCQGLAWGIAPGIQSSRNTALKARFNVSIPHVPLVEIDARACAATRGTLPEKYECDGALVAPRCISARL